MSDRRPVYLNPLTYRWPLAALVSITHRVTGVVLFVGVAFMLYALEGALSSPAGFESTKALMAEPLAKFITFALLAVLAFHFIAGIKHLLLDFHIGVSPRGGRVAAQLTVVLSVVVIALAGVWVYGH